MENAWLESQDWDKPIEKKIEDNHKTNTKNKTNVEQ